MGILTGKVALVTGGSSGIGRATVLLFAHEGARVAFTYRSNKEGAEKVSSEARSRGSEAMALQAEVSEFQRAQEVVQEVCESLGTPDILVNNAGTNRDRVIWKITEAEWDEVVATDLKGVFNYIRAVAPLFKERGSGKIITVSSINGLRGKFGQSNYSAAKAGVIGLSKTVARELGKFNVNVNVVCPGLIATDMIKSMPGDFLNKSTEEIVLGRLGEPEDVAQVIAFLSCEGSRHITGEVIKVDGGQYI